MGQPVKIQAVQRNGNYQYTITIPTHIVRALQLKKGDILDLTMDKDRMILSPDNRKK